MSDHNRIPIRIRGRGTVIGHCRRAPRGLSLSLILLPKITDVPDDQDDVLTADVISTRLTYDIAERCYWANDYACLRSDLVDAY